MFLFIYVHTLHIKYFSQWKATRTARDKAIPHIKTYTRISPSLEKIPWFVLTSANLSKAAWGMARKDSHHILNYEAGVIFIPHFVVRKRILIYISFIYVSSIHHLFTDWINYVSYQKRRSRCSSFSYSVRSTSNSVRK